MQITIKIYYIRDNFTHIRVSHEPLRLETNPLTRYLQFVTQSKLVTNKHVLLDFKADCQRVK